MTSRLSKILAGGLGFTLLNIAVTAHAQVQERLGTPNALVGRTGVAGPATVDSASINPAQAGAMRYTEVQGTWGFKSEDYVQRYPGFDAHQSPTSGLDGFPMPGFIWKVNSKLGIGGFAVPITVNQDIDKRRIPIIILSQQDYVDLIGTGKLTALAMGTVGYAVNNNLHLGLNASYIGFEGSVDLVPSAGGSSLAHVETSGSFMTIKVGAKVRINKQLSLGIVVGAFDSATNKFNVVSPLSNAGAAAGGGDSGTAPGNQSTTSTTFANPIRVGLAFQPRSQLMLTADVEYKRVDKEKQSFSLVDLTMKKREVADTVSVYGGGEIALGKGKALFGGLYEPSEVGQGSPGVNGLSGFGFMDIAQNLGEAPTKPQWAVSGGYRWQFGEIFPRGTKDKDKAERKPDPRMFFETGLIYSETSIGVDNSGEQPGAYLAKRYKVPFKFTYRF